MTWTPDRMETAKTLWAKGHSASQIARRLNEAGASFTRNAVVGKLHRMGCESRVIPSRPLRKPNAPPISRRFRPKIVAAAMPGGPKLKAAPRPKPAQIPELETLNRASLKIPLLNLEHHHCRWPTGDAGAQHFCGHAKSEGSVYCEGHRFHAGGAIRKREKKEFITPTKTTAVLDAGFDDMEIAA